MVFRGSILKPTELEKTPGIEMGIDYCEATTESCCEFSCRLQVRGHSQQRWKPVGCFEAFITQYKITPSALLASEETNGRQNKTEKWNRLRPSLWIQWHFGLQNPPLLRRSHDLHVCKTARSSSGCSISAHFCTTTKIGKKVNVWPWKQ